MRLLLPLLLCLPLTAAAAPTAGDLWPAGLGDRWSFTVEAPGAAPSTLTLTVTHRSGGWAAIQGLLGWRWWWVGQSSDHLWTWNAGWGSYSTVWRVADGAAAVARIEGDHCVDGATWQTDRAAVVTPLGTFAGCHRVARTDGCGDEGLTRLVLAPGVGPVELAWRTPTGLRVARLVSGTVGGQPISAPTPAVGIPPRPTGAPGGAAFGESIRYQSGATREEAIRAQLVAGNVPAFLRTPVELPLSALGPSGATHTGVIGVLPDVLCIGTDADFVRWPMSPLTAQRVADAYGMLLVTRRLSDQIYLRADRRLYPKPMPPTSAMTSTSYFLTHDATIRGQLAGTPLGRLIAGHKKDVVITNRLTWKPGKVAIYGWHTSVGHPIQPLSTLHHERYADYSHGIRLVLGEMTVDGVTRKVVDVLADPELAPLLSDEGPIATPRYRLP